MLLGTALCWCWCLVTPGLVHPAAVWGQMGRLVEEMPVAPGSCGAHARQMGCRAAECGGAGRGVGKWPGSLWEPMGDPGRAACISGRDSAAGPRRMMQSVVQSGKSVREFKSGPERAAESKGRSVYQLFLVLLAFCSSFSLFKQLLLHICLQIKPRGIVWGWPRREGVWHIPVKTRAA